ncbi:hypothetical protein R1sor_014056 [Riccia sorocarpa]|uniref:EGF-like domain-containing protein n=1 Tax=Riccia sorocarpa TaxID=122646 RepID=A0ABD3HBB7_9MARC
MDPLRRLSSWHRVVGLTFTVIFMVFVTDLTAAPFKSGSQILRLGHFLVPDDSSCSKDHGNAENVEQALKEVDLPQSPQSQLIAMSDESPNFTSGVPPPEFAHVPETNFSLDHSVDTQGSPTPELAPLSETQNFSNGDNEGFKASKFDKNLWRLEIGQWLSKCGVPAPILITEQFANRDCEGNCRGRGVCNHQQGICRCFHGYAGNGCELEENFLCFDQKEESDFWIAAMGNWRVSKCGAWCDPRTSFCYCGEGTKFPDRPVAEGCGFSWKDRMAGELDWNVPDSSLFSNKSGSIGWCNWSVEDFLRVGKVPAGDKCLCKYDGVAGALCEIPVESFCINQCSGNGRCRGGSCACVEGWHGIDCSIPSSLSSLKSWPRWLVPRVVKRTNASDSWQEQNLQVTVEKRRPLIYIYELPPRFNSHLLEIVFVEGLLSSEHRTANAEEADFFYVPVLGACAIERADEAPHMKLEVLPLPSFGVKTKERRITRTHFSGELYREAYEYVRTAYPYWNQSQGRDHIWLFPWDEGACAAPKEIWNSMMLVHWGNTHSKHNYSTTAYPDDNWDKIPKEWRGDHPCYDPEKDLVIPAVKLPDSTLLPATQWARRREDRPTLFYFNGNLGNDYWGRPEPEYSMGLRQKLAKKFGSDLNVDSVIGEEWEPDVVVTYQRSPSYDDELSASRFCGVLPGDGWSGRMEDSILHGCIPVIIQDGIQLPFENVLNYDEFAIRVPEDKLPHLITILRNVSESRIDSMLAAVKDVRPRFAYASAYQLEVQRQKQLGHSELSADWMRRLSDAGSDQFTVDAFSTFIQVLQFKLYNRTWTQTGADAGYSSRKDYCSHRILQ